MNFYPRFRFALRASLKHLFCSLLAAIAVAGLVFAIWYPSPLFNLVGGLAFFWIVIGVDIVCGPVLTLVLWNATKSRREVFLDLTLIIAIQISALIYGIHTLASGRPVHLVFETDRLRVVTAAEIDHADLQQAPEGLRKLPWTGPTLISVRAPRNSDEFLTSLNLSMAGQEPSVRPSWWQEYDLGRSQLLQRARPLSALTHAHPAKQRTLDEAVRRAGVPETDLLWLPITSATVLDWVVLLDRVTAQPRAYAQIDGFF